MPRTMTREISNSDDVIDSRDVIARIDELESERAALVDAKDEADETGEVDTINAASKELTKWDADDWDHGASLIRDSYFVDYCRDLVSDIGDMPREIPHYIVIDWDATADNLRADYTSVDFDGVTYWVR